MSFRFNTGELYYRVFYEKGCHTKLFHEKGCHTNLFHEKGCQAGLQRRMTKYMLGTWHYYYLNTTAVHYWDISDWVDLYDLYLL